MPGPDSQVHQSQLLTTVSVKYRNEEYISDAVFPMVQVVKRFDKISVYGRENLRVEETVRQNKSVSRSASFSVSNTAYALERHALHDVVSDEDRDNYDKPLDADVDATENLTDKIWLRKEVSAAELAFTTTTWSSNATLTSTTAWIYNTVTSDPVIAAHSAGSAILLASARMPNQAVIGWETYDSVRNHKSVLDRIKFTQLGQATPGLIASLWDVDELVIGTAIRNAEVEGVGNSNTFIWQNRALFHHVAPRPGLRQVSSGYQLVKGPQPFRTKTWREEAIDGDMLEVETFYAFKAVATDAAFLFTGTDTL